MVTLEALNALAGDCLLLRYPGPDEKERLWIIDGGPRKDTKKNIAVWSNVLLPRLAQISAKKPLPVALGMVSHIDDDHINGIQKLTSSLLEATASDPGAVKFSKFWFNSFDKLVGAKPAGVSDEVAAASLQSLVSEIELPSAGHDDHAELLMQSISQGNDLAADLRSLGLEGNQPVNDFVSARKGQKKYDIEGAKLTVVGPLQSRLDALRKEWAKALKKPTAQTRQAALQSLFLPAKSMDKSIPNLSSIVVFVEVGGHTLLLTGDAHGDDIVKAWEELGLGSKPAKIDLLKMPHHGSIRNTTEAFLKFFVADHYVFSGDGKHDNPDAPTIEATVKMHGKRKMTMHFTNEDVTWSKPYKLEKSKKSARNLKDLLSALHAAYPGPWGENMRAANEKSVVVELS